MKECFRTGKKYKLVRKILHKHIYHEKDPRWSVFFSTQWPLRLIQTVEVILEMLVSKNAPQHTLNVITIIEAIKYFCMCIDLYD